MSGHTPGPWRANPGLNRWHVVTTGKPRGQNICTLNTDRFEQQANAYLLAAAPELLAALKLAEELYQLGVLNAPGDLYERVHLARKAAIAKAEGQP